MSCDTTLYKVTHVRADPLGSFLEGASLVGLFCLCSRSLLPASLLALQGTSVTHLVSPDSLMPGL